MEKINWLYTIEQMWGHQSQSAPLKQLKQRDALILHESTSPNLDKQSTDHSQWPLIYYSESKKTLENNNQLRLGETDHKTIIKRPPVLGGMSLIVGFAGTNDQFQKSVWELRNVLIFWCILALCWCTSVCALSFLWVCIQTHEWRKEGTNPP